MSDCSSLSGDFHGIDNLQFWPWRNNNCAPACFCTVTELLRARVGVPIHGDNPDCLLAVVVSTRRKVLLPTFSPVESAFCRFHLKYAGFVHGGSCKFPSHNDHVWAVVRMATMATLAGTI